MLLILKKNRYCFEDFLKKSGINLEAWNNTVDDTGKQPVTLN